MVVPTRRVSWVRAALRAFEGFPDGARSICLDALTVAAEGVLHAFQKKSTEGVKTPLREIDLVRQRMNSLREMLG